MLMWEIDSDKQKNDISGVLRRELVKTHRLNYCEKYCEMFCVLLFF